MTKKLLVVLVALAIVFSAKVYGEEKAPKQAKPVKAPRVVETRLSETDMGRIERAISKGAVYVSPPTRSRS